MDQTEMLNGHLRFESLMNTATHTTCCVGWEGRDGQDDNVFSPHSSSPMLKGTHPADREDHARFARTDAHEAVAELPIKEMFADEGDEAEGHGCSQHIEDTCHVIYIQLAAHYLVLLIMTNASEPESFQLLHLPCKNN